MRMFAYKITRDFGFAPNPFHGVCTLATCKPNIRSPAAAGDLVIGCGSSENGLAGRLIYILRVTGKCSFQEYWDDPRFALKRPNFKSSRDRAYGDNIYHHDAAGNWIQERSHHSFEDGAANTQNLVQDTGSDNVLWSRDFIYWGSDAPEIPERFRDFNGDDLYPHVRDRRSIFAADFIAAVDDWFRSVPDRGRRGRPGAWPRQRNNGRLNKAA
jgi:hypothetical protein